VLKKRKYEGRVAVDAGQCRKIMTKRRKGEKKG
jgi:hypothetical protein